MRLFRPLVALAAAAASLSACAARKPAPSADPAAVVEAVAAEYADDFYLRLYVLTANLRPAGARYDRLPDVSPDGVRALHARQDGWTARLSSVDPAALSGHAALTRVLLLASLQGERAARVCRAELWVVSPIFGWQAMLTDTLRSQPVDSPELRAQALARIRDEVPRYLAQVTDDLREGVRLGYKPARSSVAAVLDQLDKLLAMPAADSPFASAGARAGDPQSRAEVLRAVEERLLPAVRAHRDYLRDELAKAARESAGVSGNPDGEACYRGVLTQWTGLQLDPRELHRMGLEELQRVEAEMTKLSAKSFGGLPLPELLLRLRTDPRFLFKGRDEMLQMARAAVERGWAAMPRAFARVPRKAVEVEPFAAYEEKTAAPRYFPASDDGARPARYMIRLYQADKQSRAGAESIAFHETIPGHHLQIARQQEDALPKIATLTRNAAFSEGWGLYAEGLADELGLYSDDEQRLGMLGLRALRACRVVVDTGLHVLGWERQRAIDFLLQHASLSEDFATSEVDRYISLPGQATAYLVGWREIMRMREKAQRELGPRFDLKEFHERVLAQGAPPLTLMQESVQRWIDEARRVPSR